MAIRDWQEQLLEELSARNIEGELTDDGVLIMTTGSTDLVITRHDTAYVIDVMAVEEDGGVPTNIGQLYSLSHVAVVVEQVITENVAPVAVETSGDDAADDTP